MTRPASAHERVTVTLLREMANRLRDDAAAHDRTLSGELASLVRLGLKVRDAERAAAAAQPATPHLR